MAPKFTHLHVHSHYSLLDGLPKINELINRTKELGMDSVALTDHGVMYGAVEFYKTAKKAGIKPIIGQELYITPNSLHQKRSKIDDIRYHLTTLVKSKKGYYNLIKLTTKAHLEGFYYKPRVDKDLLREHSEGLIALSGCLNGELARTIKSGNMARAEKIALEYQDIFGAENYFLEVWHHPNVTDSDKIRDEIVKLGKKLNIPIVATHDVHYLKEDDKEAQDILMAVQTGADLTREDRLSISDDDYYLASPETMGEHFKDLPEAVSNTQKVVDLCNFELSLGEIKLPHYKIPEGKSPNEYLRDLCNDSFKTYKATSETEAKKRLDYELGVIENTGFAEYFLIVQDVVNWAKGQNIVVGPGRGSVAGSLVAYLLRITNVDPLKYDLLFERFLNPDRISMPDIDLDFADTRRDEVIDYAKQKFGEDHVAQIITFGTMAARAAIRDTGRALGLPYNFCDMAAKLVPFATSLAKSLDTVSELKQLYDTDPQAKKLIDAAKKLEGVARHASTHACGVVITKEPLTDSVPLQNASRGDETVVTQYEMHAVEDLGLLKMDFLGLKTLTVIEETIKEVEKNHGKKINIDEIPFNDKKTFSLLQNVKTTGVFQLESDGMKRYLKELVPTDFEDIIAMVSLYRPGPMELLPSFIKRKHGTEPITYVHPKLEPILKNTHGIMVYQEQLMSLARDLAGFTLAQADILRKAVGKKIRSLLEEQKTKLIDGMIQNDIPRPTAQKLWELIEPFARYGFNRSHAAGYATIAYQTAYLKAHWPTEFMSALLNADSGDVERIAFLTKEAKDLDITVLPPEVNESGVNFSVTKDKNIRFGLAAIKNVGSVIAANIATERLVGEYKNMEDFLERVGTKDLNKKSLESLTKAGVFDNLAERGRLVANMEQLLSFSKETRAARDAGQSSIFDTGEKSPSIKLHEATIVEKSQKLLWEKELLGLYVSDHPLESSRKILEKKAKQIESLVPTTRKVAIGGILTGVRKIVTKKGQPMAFGQLEDFSGKIELVIFPTIFEKNSQLWEEDKVLLIKGKVQERDNELKFICDEATPLES